MNSAETPKASAMSSNKPSRWLFKPALLGAALLCAAPATAWADPPPWTPAYGPRPGHQFTAKYDPYDKTLYVQNTLAYGIPQNTCNRQAVAALVGEAAPSQTSPGNMKTVAEIAGTVDGTLVDNNIGQQMDQIDQACTGQALERAEAYQAVSWTNPTTGARYNVAITGIYELNNRYCRGYVTRVITDNYIDTVEGQACRDSNGIWKKVS